MFNSHVDKAVRKPENSVTVEGREVDTYFPFSTAKELEDYNPEVEWLVDGLLPRAGVAVLFGRHGSQKSFVCLDLAHCVSLGRPFFDRKTEQGPVLYIAAESAEDYGVRSRGWRLANGVQESSDDLWVIGQPVNFLDERQIDWLVNHDLKRVKFRPRLVIVDPLADCFTGGDENSSKDMSRVLSGIQSIAWDLNALALIVHHTGKDGTLRGHSALPSAAKTLIKAEASAAAERVTLTVTKQRSGPSRGVQLALESKVLDIGAGQTTRVLSEAPASDSINPRQSNGGSEANADMALQKLVPGMCDREWRVTSGLRGGTFDRAKKKLVDSGRVARRDGGYHPS